MGPRWKKIEKENPCIQTIYYEYDDNPEIIEKYDIASSKIPVFIFLDKNENEILRLEGEIEEKELLKHINENKDK